MENKDPNIIIASFREGDEKVFAGIYDTFYGPLYYFIQRILNDTGETEEVVADTFLKLWRLRANFETLQNVKAFLYITARNASLNTLKQKKEYARRNEEVGYLLMQHMDGPSQQDEIKAEVITRLLHEIDNLPAQCRRIFQLSVLEGLNNSEIAAKMDLTLQTVKNQKTRGLKMLKESIASKEWQVGIIAWLASAICV